MRSCARDDGVALNAVPCGRRLPEPAHNKPSLEKVVPGARPWEDYYEGLHRADKRPTRTYKTALRVFFRCDFGLAFPQAATSALAT